MLKDRTYRFIIPPSIALLAFLWGCPKRMDWLTGSANGIDFGDAIKLIVGGVAFLGFGWLLGIVATAVVQFVMMVIAVMMWRHDPERRLGRHYQGAFTKQCYENMAKYLKAEGLLPDNFKLRHRRLQLASTFRHVFPSDATRQWLVRRYALFAISFNTFFGLVCVMVLVPFVGALQPDWIWWIVVVIITLITLHRAIQSHVEHNAMIEFLAECAANKSRRTPTFNPEQPRAAS